MLCHSCKTLIWPPALQVRYFLQQTFTANRMIGHGFIHSWPPRSPDITPLDHWFWGLIKARVYHHNKPTTLPELNTRIIQECTSVTCNEVRTALCNLTHRLHLIVQEEGGLIEHLL